MERPEATPPLRPAKLNFEISQWDYTTKDFFFPSAEDPASTSNISTSERVHGERTAFVVLLDNIGMKI